MLVASLAYTTFLLVQKRRVLKGRRQSADLLILMMAANILAVPTIFALSWSADVIFSMVTENAILFVNGLLLIYMALYIDPVETHRRVFQRLSDNFEGLMRYGGDGVALLDKDGRMVSSNMSLRRILRGTCDFLEGREMVGFVPQASACHVRGAIRMALEGSTVIEVRHDLRPVGEGDGRDPTVVSTFSPVKTIDGKVEGVLVVMRDQTTVIDLEAERILRKRADAQNQLQKMLTSVIPYLLLGVDPVSRRVYLNIVLNDIEKDLSIKDGDPSPSDVARHLCSIMNNLGGRFRWASKKDSEGREGMVFYGLDCPWGTASRKNPFLCHLCRGIFTRLVGIDIGHGAQVALEETLAKGDLRCRIRVAGLGMGEVKRADIDECEGPGEHHGGGGRQEEDPDVLSDPASEGPIAGDAEATPASDAAGPNGAGVARLGTAVESMMFGPEVRT
jgi:PAS domain-containing protein